MKKFLLVILTAVFFTACQKEISDYINNPGNPGGGTDSTNVSALKGIWNFDTLHAAYRDSSNVSIDTFYNLTVSDVNYSSFGNNGTLTINDSQFIFTNFTYSISTNINAVVIQDGSPVDTSVYPFSYYVPPANSTSKYQLIGTDSVYFPEGSSLSADTSSAVKIYGLKFKINGNALTFIQPLNVDTTFNDGGLTYQHKTLGSGYIYFHKK